MRTRKNPRAANTGARPTNQPAGQVLSVDRIPQIFHPRKIQNAGVPDADTPH